MATFLRSVSSLVTTHDPKWRPSNFRLRYAALYPGANSRGELLPSPRANAQKVVRAVCRGKNE